MGVMKSVTENSKEMDNCINEYFKKYAYMAYILGIFKELKNEIKSDLFLKKIQKPTCSNIFRSLNESDYSEVMNKNDYKNLIKNMLYVELTKVYLKERNKINQKKEQTTLTISFLRARKLIYAYEGDETLKKFEILLEDSENHLDHEKKLEKLIKNLSRDSDKLIDNEKISRKLKKTSVNNHSILGIVTFCFLFYVIMWQPSEYGNYQVLSWLVCAFSCWTAFKIYKKSPQKFSLMIFSVIAILFNPILPIKFEQDTWLCIDVFTALAVLIYTVKSLREK